jgi:predicted nucleic-acid-binding protein
MKIAADTNVLVRIMTGDDLRQSRIAQAEAIRHLINSANVVVNRPAVAAGLTQMDAGGDFADGAIAYEGNWLGAETFVSFDREAVKLMETRGESARLLS